MALEAADTGAPASVNEAVIANAAPGDGAPPAPTPVTIVEPARPSMDDDLAAAYDRIQSRQADGKQPRASDGKFAPRESTEADASGEPPAEGAEQQVSPDQPEGVSVEPAKLAIDAPHSWSADMKAKWSSLAPEVQGYIAQRESEAHKAITRAGEQVKAYEPFDQLTQHYKDSFARRGVTPAQAFAVLLNAQAQLDANPLAGLVQIGQSYGYDLRPLLQAYAQQQPQQGQPQGPDPYVAALLTKVQQLEGQMTAQQRAAYEAQQAEMQTAIDGFAKDKPYFEDVRQTMILLLQGSTPENGGPQTLDEAYDMAIHANKGTRSRIQEDQRKADAKRAEDDAKKKADAARRAAAVNVKSGTATHQSPKTIDDTLSASYDAIQARG